VVRASTANRHAPRKTLAARMAPKARDSAMSPAVRPCLRPRPQPNDSHLHSLQGIAQYAVGVTALALLDAATRYWGILPNCPASRALTRWYTRLSTRRGRRFARASAGTCRHRASTCHGQEDRTSGHSPVMSNPAPRAVLDTIIRSTPPPDNPVAPRLENARSGRPVSGGPDAGAGAAGREVQQCAEATTPAAVEKRAVRLCTRR